MKNSHKTFLLGLALGPLLISCNSGSNLYYTGGGTQCVPNGTPSPIPTDPSGFPGYSLAKWTDLTSSIAQTGSFTYTGAEVYFYDYATEFEIEVSDGQDATATDGYSQAISCIRNYANIGGLASTTMSNQLMSAFIFTPANIWTAAAKTLGFELLGQQVLAVANAATLPPSNTSVDPQSVFSNYTTAGPAIKNNIVLWCNGSCLPTDQTKLYQIRASKTSTKAPFDVNEIVAFYTWTLNPSAAAAKALQFGQLNLAR